MSYQRTVFANDQYYHVLNRGVEKRITFNDKRDYDRFIETINYYNAKDEKIRFSFKDRSSMLPKEGIRKPLVEIISYCLMPNHFHLLLKQIEDNGITIFLSKLSNSYTKYFNTRHKRIGPLFQGSFKSIRIEDDEQLLHVSRYIHLNPIIDYLTKDLKSYLFSSYREYLGMTEGFCEKDIILSNFSKNSTYEQFVLDNEDYGRTIKNIERLLFNE